MMNITCLSTSSPLSYSCINFHRVNAHDGTLCIDFVLTLYSICIIMIDQPPINLKYPGFLEVSMQHTYISVSINL